MGDLHVSPWVFFESLCRAFRLMVLFGTYVFHTKGLLMGEGESQPSHLGNDRKRIG